MSYYFENFPMPPSMNNLWKPMGNKIIKTIEGRRFDQAVNIFHLKNIKILDKISLDLKDYLDQDKMNALEVNCFFIFPDKRCITKDGRIKVLDCNNFLKPVLDGLVKTIDIDDKYFIINNIEKVTWTQLSEEGKVAIQIRKSRMRTWDDLKEYRTNAILLHDAELARL